MHKNGKGGLEPMSAVGGCTVVVAGKGTRYFVVVYAKRDG